jgi:hypothetical protein
MRDIDIPNGAGAVGLGDDDIPTWSRGRWTYGSWPRPREVIGNDRAGISRRSTSLS